MCATKEEAKIDGLIYQNKIRSFYKSNFQLKSFLSWQNNQQELEIRKKMPENLTELIASDMIKKERKRQKSLPEGVIDVTQHSFVRKVDRH